MPRTKSIAQRKHRKIKSLARGFKQARRRRVKSAKEALMHAGKYAYIGRKQKKRNLRSLWITRMTAAAKEKGLSYSKLINLLNKAEIKINRKILSDIAVKDPNAFDKIIDSLK